MFKRLQEATKIGHAYVWVMAACLWQMDFLLLFVCGVYTVYVLYILLFVWYGWVPTFNERWVFWNTQGGFQVQSCHIDSLKLYRDSCHSTVWRSDHNVVIG